jgi:LysR family nod box-dependent transcriptional activator
MSKVQFRNIDLNLLIPFKALLHERNVTRAAKRIHLSQSAMSRALDRLRSEFGDELLA